MTGATKHRLARLGRRLSRSTSGLALTEFALVLPILTTMGLYGTELSYMAIVNMRISQMALEVADNASRMEQTNNSGVAPTVTEADITSVLTGAQKEGASYGFNANGKVILSSLEKDPTTGKQFIHWQRCTGLLAATSAYGTATLTPSNSTLVSMGSGTTKITATSGTAVMFAEIYYNYTGLFGNLFVSNMKFKQEAAFVVRDIRDLQQTGSPMSAGVTPTGTASLCT